MPRVVWPLLRGRPCIQIVLTRVSDGQPQLRRLLADSGAGTSSSGYEMLLGTADCLMSGGIPVQPVTLAGAYTGRFPVYRVRVAIPQVGVSRVLRVVAVPTLPAGFDGIACFRFLNSLTYGNFGDSTRFGLET